MEKFTQLSSIALPLTANNIDTDQLYPGRFLLLIDKAGAGDYLLHDQRFLEDHSANPDFVLNDQRYKNAEILLAGENFGCGSSREQAVWAIRDYGFRCVIALSFGEIFYANCFNNQVLPIVVEANEHAKLKLAAETGEHINIDLAEQRVSCGDLEFGFQIDEQNRELLLNGWDEISRQLANDLDDIKLFEANQAKTQPWLWKPII